MTAITIAIKSGMSFIINSLLSFSMVSIIENPSKKRKLAKIKAFPYQIKIYLKDSKKG